MRWTSGQEVRKLASRAFLDELAPVQHVEHEQRGAGGRVGTGSTTRRASSSSGSGAAVGARYSSRPYASAAQEGKHREHAAVVVRGRGQIELEKMLVTCFSTARSVTNSRSAIAWLERPSAMSSSTSRSRGVSSVERVVLTAPAEELGDDCGVERGSSLGDAPHRRRELVEVGHAVLEQVADALPSLSEKRSIA